jgi:MoxR-like ATPase
MTDAFSGWLQKGLGRAAVLLKTRDARACREPPLHEGQVRLDGTLHRLDETFFVIATQNPVEFHGTYPLPEAQLDRFAMRLSLGYVSAADEVEILTRLNRTHPLDAVAPCARAGALRAVRSAAADIRVGAELKRYIVDIVAGTRTATGVVGNVLRAGAVPR